MTPFTKSHYNSIWATLNSNGGYDIPNSDYKIKRNYGTWLVYKKDNAVEPLLRVDIDSTSYCCGVAQAGAFNEFKGAENVPDEVLDHFFKVLVSFARHTYRKGVFQGWFYRTRSTKKYQHPVIMKMFLRNSMKKIGKETYNPNSGNYIRGFQGSILMKGKN